MSATADHDERWSDRLLDWVDGDRDPADAAQFEAHRAGCTSCQERLRELAELDASLRAALPSVSLDAAFDEGIFARIDAMDENQRVAARRRAEQEFRENLQSLSRDWKRTLGFVIPGVVAGIALAFALTGWFGDTGVTQAVVAESSQGFMRIDGLRDVLGGDIGAMVRMVLTATLGAGIGLIVARWLAASAE
jgi:anti-sigma factor RsiW